MSEQAAIQQPAAPAPVPAPAAQPAAPEAPEEQLSPEAMLAKAMGLGEPDTLRDPDTGRYLAKPKAAPEAPQEPQEAQPAPEETPAEPVKLYVGDEDLKKFAKIKVQGEELEVSLDEALKGHMRESDYTRKTKELAETRRQVQSQAEQALHGERTAYLQALGSLRDLVINAHDQELGKADWNTLARDEPAKYVMLQNRARQFEQTLNAIQQRSQQVQQKQAQDSQKALAQAAQDAVVAIKEAIPNWNDDLYSSLLKRGVDTYGYTQKEIGQVYDPRFIRLLHDANQFREMQSNKPLVEKKIVEAAPTALKPGAAKQTSQNANQERAVSTARDSLRQTGSVDALANFLGAIEKRKR